MNIYAYLYIYGYMCIYIYKFLKFDSELYLETWPEIFLNCISSAIVIKISSMWAELEMIILFSIWGEEKSCTDDKINHRLMVNNIPLK